MKKFDQHLFLRQSAALNKIIHLCVLDLIREAPKECHATATIQQVGKTGCGHLSCFDFLTTQQAIVFQYGEISHARCYKICSFLSQSHFLQTLQVIFASSDQRSEYRLGCNTQLQARRSRRQYAERSVHK